MAKKSNQIGGEKIAIGAGIAAIAAAAAGAYLLYGTDAGKKKRKQIKSWTLKAKADVLEKMESLKDINEEIYNKIVDEVAQKYKAVKEVDVDELGELVRSLQGQWKSIKKHIPGTAKKARTSKKK